MPKGHKTQKTLSKEAGRELLREMVMAQMQPMVDAQVANAMGLQFLVIREKKSGKFVKRVTEAQGKITLRPEHEVVEIWGKDPSVQAFTDLMNRTLDKPKEQPLEIELGVRDLGERIRAARQRAGKR